MSRTIEPVDETAWKRVDEVVVAVADEVAADALARIDERFGIPASTFDRYLVFQPNRQNLWLVDRDLRLPCRPAPFALGMPFFYVNMRFPRLTTAAAVQFGPLARRNHFDAHDDEVAMLLHRQEIRVDAERAAAIDGPGYALLRHRGCLLGLGFFHVEDDGAWMRGMLPRSWTARLGIDAPVDDALADEDGGYDGDEDSSSEA